MLRKLIQLGLPLVPRPIVGRVARRYVAGASLEEGLSTIRRLNDEGFAATLALLGEEVIRRERASDAVVEYTRACSEIEGRGLDSGISIKLTLLGLKIDADYCRENLERVASAATQSGLLVRIDMEDRTCTDDTLRLYQECQARHGNLGIVLQAYMRRTLDDIASLKEGTEVRLCKGIYVEPPEVAFQGYDEVRAKFTEALDGLLAAQARVGIATHDRHLVDAALERIEALDLSRDRYEFQTLLGVDEELRDRLRDAGHKVRVYIPYGEDWYAYSVRRLRENPQIGVYVLRSLVGLR